jgi:hypothetical protein
VRLLLARARDDAASPLRRVVCASAARACDALLREEVAELSDIFFEVTCQVGQAKDLATMGEASMDPDAAAVFREYATMVQRNEQVGTLHKTIATAESLRVIARAFPLVGSARVEALRLALLAYADAVEAVASSQCISELAGNSETTASPIVMLAEASRALAQLVVGARRRLGTATSPEPRAAGSVVRMIDVCIDHTLRGSPGMFDEVLPDVTTTLRSELPPAIADVAIRALSRIRDLPIAPIADDWETPPIIRQKDPPLPVWLPPGRTLGGFYVIRPLGAGAVGSVFIVCRNEDKARKRAPRMALKVPEYGGDVARTLSEKEFLQLFREEAGTLLTLPQHPNLARLITFDAGAVPKPILVMELVDGPTLERLIEARSLNTADALAILDGICAGLEVLHEAGVGHLDLKPSNVILREPMEAAPASMDMSASRLVSLPRITDHLVEGTIPVLVDFGLAGRKLRPGCATAAYGAPEIWGQMYEEHQVRPMEADVYAFGCVAWEVLTGTELFQGSTQMATLTAHLRHDGGPPHLAQAASSPELEGLVKLLHATLRQDPRQRMAIRQVRRELAALAPRLRTLPWPITS